MKFEKYHISEDIKQNLAKLGFKRPTDIQFKSIPSIVKGEDVLAIALCISRYDPFGDLNNVVG
jgi:ATP-dependent RNA helicase RhlE